MSLQRNPNLNRDFITRLPLQIINEIFLRLSIRTIISCKCVCKSWLDLVKTREFAMSHLPNSVPALAVYHVTSPTISKVNVFQLNGKHTSEFHIYLHHPKLQDIPGTKFDLPFCGLLHNSCDGLLFVPESKVIYICNPITRDYMRIRCPQECNCSHPYYYYGFGASKTTGKYKVVKISHYSCVDDQHIDDMKRIQIYTLGTRSWRIIAPGSHLKHVGRAIKGQGVFLKGFLHWMVSDLNVHQPRICCLDLETELFSTSSLPLCNFGLFTELFALGDYLCIYDKKLVDYHEVTDLWVMKEYGVEKSWEKKFVISSAVSNSLGDPINVFEDGDILVTWQGSFLSYYSKKNKTVYKVDMFKPGRGKLILHTPSFVLLKSFEMETVRSF